MLGTIQLLLWVGILLVSELMLVSSVFTLVATKTLHGLSIQLGVGLNNSFSIYCLVTSSLASSYSSLAAPTVVWMLLQCTCYYRVCCGKPALITNQILYCVTGVEHGTMPAYSVLYMLAPLIYLYLVHTVPL